MKETQTMPGVRGRRMALIPVFLFGLLSIIATGDGGGGGDDGSQASSTSSTQTVSGVIGQSASAAKAAAAGDAIAEIRSFDAAGTQIDAASVPVVNGLFSAPLKMASEGGHLLVTVEKEGFTDLSKRIDYDAPGDVNLAAELRAVDMVVASPGSVLKASGESMRAFSFAVIRSPDGTRKAVAGSDAVRVAKAAADLTELEVQIPANSVDADTLVGRFSNFDPSNAEDESNFPGNYQDSEGNTLLSLAFDYINITDENGANVGDLAPAATPGKAAADDTVVYRYLPKGSCPSLVVGDSDADKAGFQVPVYTMNPRSGLWVQLGLGTMVVEDGLGGWTVLAADQVTPDACGTTAYYLEIAVSNEEFLRYWWNLDYPLVFDEPKRWCIDKTLVDSDQQPLVGWYLSMADNEDADGNSFDRAGGYTDAQGKVRLTVAQLSSEADTDTRMLLSYRNRFSGTFSSELVTPGLYPDCTPVKNTVTNPLHCTVQGRLVRESGGVRANTAVWMSASDVRHVAEATSDADGRFSARVYCGKDYSVAVGYQDRAGFNVNQQTVDFPDYEDSDNGSQVVLGDISLPNLNPYVSGWLGTRVIYAGGSTRARILASDADGDYPLSYAVKDSSGAIDESGSIASAGAGAVEVIISAAGLTAGSVYELSVTATDSQGGEMTRGLGSLTVCDTNCAPSIQYAYADRDYARRGERVGLYASAYDLDDSGLSYEWTVDTNAAGSPSVFASRRNASFVIPDKARNGDRFHLTLTVTDASGASDSRTLVVGYINRAPDIVSVSPGESTVPAGQVVALAVRAFDRDADELSYQWLVDGVPSGSGATASYTIPADAQDGTTFEAQVTVSDGVGGSSSRSFTLTVGSADSDTTVVIQ